MLFTLALMAQTASLPADSKGAAITCASALAAQGGPNLSIEGSAVIMYLLVLSSSKDETSAPFVQTLNAAAARVAQESQQVKSPDEIVAACHLRFPVAWASVTKPLPADRYERGVLCTNMSGVYVGILRRAARKSGDSGELDRVTPRVSAIANSISHADYQAHGVHNEEEMDAQVPAIYVASLKYGNSQAIFAACDAAYPR